MSLLVLSFRELAVEVIKNFGFVGFLFLPKNTVVGSQNMPSAWTVRREKSVNDVSPA